MADRLAELEARLDYTSAQIEALAKARAGLHGSAGLPPTTGQVIKAQRAAAAKGGRKGLPPTKGGRGTGQPCGKGHIAADLTCRQGAGASVPPAGSSAPAPEPPRLSMDEHRSLQQSVDSWRRPWAAGLKPARDAADAYAKERGLDDLELGAVLGYARLNYTDINRTLRGQELSRQADLKPDEARAHAHLITEALQKLPEAPGPVFRGVTMSDEHLAQFQVGRVGADPAFQSTSAIDPFDTSHSGGVVMEFATGGYDMPEANAVVMRFAPGHGGRMIDRLSGQDGEREALIPPGTPFRVTSVRKGTAGREQGLTIIDLEPATARRDAVEVMDGLDARLLRLRDHLQADIRGAHHLDALGFEPGKHLVEGAALPGGGVAGPRQDHAVAEAVAGVGHGDQVRSLHGSREQLEALEARLERLDARRKEAPGQLGLDLGGSGQPCGRGHIAAGLKCHQGAGAGKAVHPLVQETAERKQAEAAAAAAAQAKLAAAPSPAGLELGQDQQGRLLVNGAPAKQLSKGNYGDTYKVDTPSGPVLVKVDRLQGGDPQESDPSVSREQQRLNMANRELDNLRRASALGVGPEPIGEVVKLPADGRLAIAYRMVEGAPLKASFTSTEPDTPEAAAILAQPGARERLDAGVLRIARVMADAGLEHGDVHGANIVVQPDGSPMLIDWGIGGQESPGPAASRGQLEGRLLLQMNYYTQTLNRHGEGPTAVADGIGKRLDQALTGLRAADDLQRKLDSDWEDESLSPDGFTFEMVKEANRLKREKGLTYDEAQREAGILPRITPEMKQATDAARDAHFGDADLAEMRRWVDQQVMGPAR